MQKIFKKYQPIICTIILNIVFLPFGFATTCWDKAGQTYGLDPWLLLSIALTESSFKEGIKSKNTNGTYDLGLMQINTIHTKYFSEKFGLTQADLQYNSCAGVMAAGHLLKQSIQRYGYNIDGIGGYHSRTPHLRKKYGNKVIKNYNQLVSKYYLKGESFSFEKHRKSPSVNSKNNSVVTYRTYEYRDKNYNLMQPQEVTPNNNGLNLTKVKKR